MKNLPESQSQSRFESIQKTARLFLNSSTMILSLGILIVVSILSWEFLLTEFGNHQGPDRWRKGAVATRNLYSPVHFTFDHEDREIEILAGERILSRGQKIDGRGAAKVRVLMAETTSLNVSNLWGNLLFTLLCTTILVVFLLRSIDHGAPPVHEPLLLVVIVGTLAVAKITVSYAEGDLLYLVNPVPVALILLSIFATTEVATIVHVILVLLTGVLVVSGGVDNPFRYTVYLLIGGLSGIFACSSKQSERADILRAGMAIGISNVLCIISQNLIYQDAHLKTGFTDVFHPSWFGFFNGIACSMLVLGLIPFLEDLFQVTTSTRYLELINPNHPCMQKLVTEAPGTYHHSQNVAVLAEKGAELIGADPYLAKAGSYYHDLGKTKRPFYFIENQMGGVNYHDFLSPQLSKLIIHSHTKDGVEIGKRYGIPRAITDIMIQHHGTDVVAFFYHRALQAEGEDAVDMESFRYPGVKPQTKEAGVIMLADACEAATRTMKKPTPQAIENLVGKIINAKFVDGQFDECDVTKRDFEVLAQSFTKTLVSMYHSRIVYPDEVLDKVLPVPGMPRSKPKDKPRNGNKTRDQGGNPPDRKKIQQIRNLPGEEPRLVISAEGPPTPREPASPGAAESPRSLTCENSPPATASSPGSGGRPPGQE